jgi:hypothetical protein
MKYCSFSDPLNCIQSFQLSPDFYKYDISENYYYGIGEIYQVLNDNKKLVNKKMVENILMDSRLNLTFTNLLSEMYSNVLFLLILLDTYQIRKYENIREKNIKFLQNYLIRLNDQDFNNTLRKHYNIFEAKEEEEKNKNYYFINRRKNMKIHYNILIKFLLARRFFEKIYFTILEKRYAPYGKGYYEAKSSFEKYL